MVKIWLLCGAILALLGVILGAFGAHALKPLLSEHGREIFRTAVQYQMYHALALLGIGLLQHQFPALSLNPSGWCFVLGVLFFSGSLYILALMPVPYLGFITPVGGLLFVGGWVWIIYQILRSN